MLAITRSLMMIQVLFGNHADLCIILVFVRT